jgi:putative transposase
MPEQKQIINKTVGVCRYVYNFFLAHNKELHEQGQEFMVGMEFSKWLNNEFLPNNEEYLWLKEVSAKAVKQSIMNAHVAFMRFFNKRAKFPRFKKKSRSDVKMYFVKNDAKHIIKCERHRIKIPTLGWVQIKEKGYLPTGLTIRSGSVSIKAGRYYVSVLVNIPDIKTSQTSDNEGLGVDLGLKEFAVISNGTVKENINKTKQVKKAEKKLKHEQRKLSRKYEGLKKRNKKEEGRATRQNIQKQIIEVQKIHQRLNNIRTEHINQTVNELVKTKPNHITIEDLNVSGMMMNRHLSRAVAQQKFYEFRIKLENKCRQNGIELRVANRFYPSSKLCHHCGNKKTALRLSDRIFICDCGYTEDRDYNASLNLRDAKTYKIA